MVMVSLFFRPSMRRFCAWVDTHGSYETTSIVEWRPHGLEHRFNVHVDIRDVRFLCPCLVYNHGPNSIQQIARLAWTEGAEADSVKEVGMVQLSGDNDTSADLACHGPYRRLLHPT